MRRPRLLLRQPAVPRDHLRHVELGYLGSREAFVDLEHDTTTTTIGGAHVDAVHLEDPIPTLETILIRSRHSQRARPRPVRLPIEPELSAMLRHLDGDLPRKLGRSGLRKLRTPSSSR